MREKLLLCIILLAVLFGLTSLAYADRRLLLRSAQEDTKAMVAVEAYLEGDLIEAKVSVGMRNARPSILNVIIEGPGIGRLVPISVKEVYASLSEAEEKPYPTEKIGGMIVPGEKSKDKKLEGAVSRKSYIFKIPKDKIAAGAQYDLKVKVGTVKQVAGEAAQYTRFIFSLGDLSQLIAKKG